MAAVGAQSCFLRAAIQKAGRPKADLTDPQKCTVFSHRPGPAHHNGGYCMQTFKIQMAHSCFSLEAGRQANVIQMSTGGWPALVSGRVALLIYHKA
jgi:hypothetical protein